LCIWLVDVVVGDPEAHAVPHEHPTAIISPAAPSKIPNVVVVDNMPAHPLDVCRAAPDAYGIALGHGDIASHDPTVVSIIAKEDSRIRVAQVAGRHDG
jgi:hypothetical protein